MSQPFDRAGIEALLAKPRSGYLSPHKSWGEESGCVWPESVLNMADFIQAAPNRLRACLTHIDTLERSHAALVAMLDKARDYIDRATGGEALFLDELEDAIKQAKEIVKSNDDSERLPNVHV